MNIIGNETIQESLQKSVDNNRVFHAYLFSGPKNLGKMTLAQNFIKNLDSSPNDIYTLEKDSAIKIKEVRELQKKLQLTSHSKYKIALINDAALISKEAANALLKVLEEPKNTVLILITQDQEKIISTIQSRCIVYNFNLVPKKQIRQLLDKKNLNESEKEEILTLSCGRPGIALKLSENKKAIEDRKKFLSSFAKLLSADINTQFLFVEKIMKQPQSINKIISLWISWFRDLLLIKSNNNNLALNQSNLSELESFDQKYPKEKIIELINYLKDIPQDGSTNEKLAFENFFLLTNSHGN